MSWHDLFLVVAAFVSEVMGTLSGFGSSTFFVPIAQLFESFQFVLALTAFLHCFGNLARLWAFKSFFDRKLFFRLALPSVVMTGLGAWMLRHVDQPSFIRYLGLALMLSALMMLVKPSFLQSQSRWLAPILMPLSGFLTGFVGTGGALRGVALSSLNLSSHLFVSVSSSVDVGGDFLRLWIYFQQGFMDWNQAWYIPALGLAAFLGTKLGKLWLNRIPKDTFHKIVAVSVGLSGLAMWI